MEIPGQPASPPSRQNKDISPASGPSYGLPHLAPHSGRAPSSPPKRFDFRRFLFISFITLIVVAVVIVFRVFIWEKRMDETEEFIEKQIKNAPDPIAFDPKKDFVYSNVPGPFFSLSVNCRQYCRCVLHRSGSELSKEQFWQLHGSDIFHVVDMDGVSAAGQGKPTVFQHDFEGTHSDFYAMSCAQSSVKVPWVTSKNISKSSAIAMVQGKIRFVGDITAMKKAPGTKVSVSSVERGRVVLSGVLSQSLHLRCKLTLVSAATVREPQLSTEPESTSLFSDADWRESPLVMERYAHSRENKDSYHMTGFSMLRTGLTPGAVYDYVCSVSNFSGSEWRELMSEADEKELPKDYSRDQKLCEGSVLVSNGESKDAQEEVELTETPNKSHYHLQKAWGGEGSIWTQFKTFNESDITEKEKGAFKSAGLGNLVESGVSPAVQFFFNAGLKNLLAALLGSAQDGETEVAQRTSPEEVLTNAERYVQRICNGFIFDCDMLKLHYPLLRSEQLMDILHLMDVITYVSKTNIAVHGNYHFSLLQVFFSLKGNLEVLAMFQIDIDKDNQEGVDILEKSLKRVVKDFLVLDFIYQNVLPNQHLVLSGKNMEQRNEGIEVLDRMVERFCKVGGSKFVTDIRNNKLFKNMHQEVEKGEGEGEVAMEVVDLERLFNHDILQEDVWNDIWNLKIEGLTGVYRGIEEGSFYKYFKEAQEAKKED